MNDLKRGNSGEGFSRTFFDDFGRLDYNGFSLGSFPKSRGEGEVGLQTANFKSFLSRRKVESGINSMNRAKRPKGYCSLRRLFRTLNRNRNPSNPTSSPTLTNRAKDIRRECRKTPYKNSCGL